eukprot:363835-Chlamydomonas_euryale.AAC.3
MKCMCTLVTSRRAPTPPPPLNHQLANKCGRMPLQLHAQPCPMTINSRTARDDDNRQATDAMNGCPLLRSRTSRDSPALTSELKRPIGGWVSSPAGFAPTSAKPTPLLGFVRPPEALGYSSSGGFARMPHNPRP